MSGVFTRGRMRLYLLKILGEEPRHGYEILRLLRERLGGSYAPSPGSVYPRLRNLESEGLVEHQQRGGRKVYRLTPKGRSEVADRKGELEALESDIRTMSDLADEIGEHVHDAVQGIGGELTEAAGRITPPRHAGRPRNAQRHEHPWPQAVELDGAGGMVDAQLHVLVSRVRELVAQQSLTSEQIGRCAAILHDTYQRITEALSHDAGE